MLNEIRIRRDKARTLVNCGLMVGYAGTKRFAFLVGANPPAGTGMASYKQNVRRYDIACNEEPINKIGIIWQ